jgi:hypothetical protein
MHGFSLLDCSKRAASKPSYIADAMALEAAAARAAPINYRLSDETGEPAGEARMLERPDGAAKRFAIVIGDLSLFRQGQFGRPFATSRIGGGRAP